MEQSDTSGTRSKKQPTPQRGGRGFVPRVVAGTPCRGAVPGGAAFRGCRFAPPPATFWDASGIGSSPPHAGSSRFLRCLSPAASWQSPCPRPLCFFVFIILRRCVGGPECVFSNFPLTESGLPVISAERACQSAFCALGPPPQRSSTACRSLGSALAWDNAEPLALLGIGSEGPASQ